MEVFTTLEVGTGVFGFVSRESKLVATYLPQSRRAVVARIHAAFADAVEDASILPRFRQNVASYYRGKCVRFSVRVDLTDQPPYRRAVLEACRRIDFGKTASYTDLARATNNPRAARAVGSAMANNPLPLVIPCHRVLRSDGTLGGFSSPKGIREKLRMLELEGVSTNGLDRVVRVPRRAGSAKVA